MLLFPFGPFSTFLPARFSNVWLRAAGSEGHLFYSMRIPEEAEIALSQWWHYALFCNNCPAEQLLAVQNGPI